MPVHEKHALVLHGPVHHVWQEVYSALAQTGWAGPQLTADNWRIQVRERIVTLDWESARADVRPFLERERDLSLVDAETLRKLLDRGREV